LTPAIQTNTATTERAKQIVRHVRQIHTSNARRTISIGMTRAETGRALPNTAQTDVREIPAPQTIAEHTHISSAQETTCIPMTTAGTS